MARINSCYRELPRDYFTSEILQRTKTFTDARPTATLYKLSIGNTTEPIVPSVLDGLRTGVEKLGSAATYTGYGDEQGDARLRKRIAEWYTERGVRIEPSEVFISDGAKTDCANISSIFSDESVVAVSDPVYPVYRDSNILAGRRVVYMPSLEKNGFVPVIPHEKVDIIFLCSPNNPTGVVITEAQLRKFVEYAQKNKSVIVFDAAYSEYIQDTELPKSIYQIDGARTCAIEIQSFSKSAGFTGVRLGWTIVPKELMVEDSSPEELNRSWNRRQATMFNGASNIVQEGGLSILSEAGQRQTREQVHYYMENARIIRQGLENKGLTVFGGIYAPYVWVKCPSNLSSWEFFAALLEKACVVTIPGCGFGKHGEGYIRVSAFGRRENIESAVQSIQKNL